MASDYYQMQASLSRKRSSLYAERQRIGELNEKIERLETAKGNVRVYHDGAKALTGLVRLYDVQGKWQGQNYDTYELNRTDAADGAGRTYCDAIDAYHDAICDKICDLKNQRTDGLLLIDELCSGINWLANEIDKLNYS